MEQLSLKGHCPDVSSPHWVQNEDTCFLNIKLHNTAQKCICIFPLRTRGLIYPVTAPLGTVFMDIYVSKYLGRVISLSGDLLTYV